MPARLENVSKQRHNELIQCLGASQKKGPPQDRHNLVWQTPLILLVASSCNLYSHTWHPIPISYAQTPALIARVYSLHYGLQLNTLAAEKDGTVIQIICQQRSDRAGDMHTATSHVPRAFQKRGVEQDYFKRSIEGEKRTLLFFKRHIVDYYDWSTLAQPDL